MQLPNERLDGLLLAANGLLLVLLILGLYGMGRPMYCHCGELKIWHAEVFSPQVSQHLTDWYTFTHVLHGILLYAFMQWVFPHRRWEFNLLLAVGLEGSWELVENTDYVIEYYRNNTMAVAFYGDTIVNSLTDVLAMIGGFGLAKHLSPEKTSAVFAGTELFLIYSIRDSLLLNVLMLVYPLETLKQWQTALM